MRIKMVALLAVTALMLSLCACGGGEIDKSKQGEDGEIGASPSTESNPSSSKTAGLGSGTGTKSGKTEAISSQTAIKTQTGTTTRALEVLKNGNSTWKEIPIKEVTGWGKRTPYTINLKKVITEADYVFSGTVIGHKEYEVSCTDENGKQSVPQKSSIIEVEVNHDYYGQSPVKGNTIKIYSPSSICASDNSVLVKEQGEYVFVTQALDDEYVERRNKQNPADRAGEEHYADVYVSGAYYRIFPIDNEMVFPYYQYFSWNDDIMNKVKSNAETDKINSLAMKEDWYLALNKQDFDDAFNQLFKNPEILPPANTKK